MVITKNSAEKILAAIVSILLLMSPGPGAQDLNWKNFTSYKSVREMRLFGDSLYLATSGGIMVITDFKETGLEYNNLDGLGTNDITDIMRDTEGQIWMTGFGRLILFDGSSSRQYLFFDIDDELFALHRVVDDGDRLWIGTEMGLVLFSKTGNGGQIQDSYQLFDDLNPAPEVYDILLEGDSIWIATSSGLAVADRSEPSLLKSPLAWEGFGIEEYSELQTDTVTDVVSLQSQIYVATRRGAHLLQMDTDTAFLPAGLEDTARVYDLKLENDSLILYYEVNGSRRMGTIEDTSVTLIIAGGLPSPPTTGIGDGFYRWAATQEGVFRRRPDEAFEEYPHTGIPGNHISDITVNEDGVVTAGFRSDALAQFDGNSWSELDVVLRAGTTVLMTDSAGNTWAGTEGNGLYFYDGDTIVNYDENNSALRGNIDNPPFGATYVIVLGLATDGNYIYAVSFRALNGYPIAIGDLDNLDDPAGWDSIGVGDGLTDIYINSLDLYDGQLAVSTWQNGVFVCSVGDDPFNTDITCEQFTRENSLLISNDTKVARYSPDGVLWVGTTFGLSRYDIGIDRFVNVDLSPEISSNINSLEFDGRGNLWVGTENGLATVDAVTGEVRTYTTLNSGIVSDEVTSVTFDRFTGDVYVGTSSGFSLVPSQMGQPTFEVEQVVAFPNPFVIDDPDDRLSFNFGEAGDVRIFNVAGELVRETTVGTPWDGKNDYGKDVASGVYIFVIEDRDGNVGKGKFLLVRK